MILQIDLKITRDAEIYFCKVPMGRIGFFIILNGWIIVRSIYWAHAKVSSQSTFEKSIVNKSSMTIRKYFC